MLVSKGTFSYFPSAQREQGLHRTGTGSKKKLTECRGWTSDSAWRGCVHLVTPSLWARWVSIDFSRVRGLWSFHNQKFRSSNGWHACLLAPHLAAMQYLLSPRYTEPLFWEISQLVVARLVVTLIRPWQATGSSRVDWPDYHSRQQQAACCTAPSSSPLPIEQWQQQEGVPRLWAWKSPQNQLPCHLKIQTNLLNSSFPDLPIKSGGLFIGFFKNIKRRSMCWWFLLFLFCLFLFVYCLVMWSVRITKPIKTCLSHPLVGSSRTLFLTFVRI